MRLFSVGLLAIVVHGLGLWNGLGRAIEEATAGDREERVFLRADKAITYDEIMQAMNALRAAGYVHVALVGAEAAGAAQ